MKHNWKSAFYLLWMGEAISVLSSAVLQMALIWHLTATTQSAAVLSAASIAGFLPAALLGSIAGTLVDRWNRKAVMIGADLFIALVSLSLTIFALFAELPIWLILVVLFGRSIGTAFHTPAISAVTPLLVPETMLTRCSGLTQTLQTLGYIAGTAIAGVLYPIWSLSGMVMLDVAGAVFASVTVACVPIPDVPRHESGQSPHILREIREGYRALQKNKGLFSLLWIGAAFSFLYSPINALFPLMIMGYFGGTTAQSSLAEIVFSAGMLAGGLLIGVWGGFKNRAISIIGALFLMSEAIGLAGLLPPTGFVAFSVLCLFMGISAPFYSGPQIALMQERIESAFLGRIFGLYSSIMSLAMPFGLVISGLFAERVGVHTWFFLSGLLCFALTLVSLALPSVRRIEKEAR